MAGWKGNSNLEDEILAEEGIRLRGEARWPRRGGRRGLHRVTRRRGAGVRFSFSRCWWLTGWELEEGKKEREFISR